VCMACNIIKSWDKKLHLLISYLALNGTVRHFLFNLQQSG
jgi:hypothetical protein